MTDYTAPGLLLGRQNRSAPMAGVYGNVAYATAKVSIPVGAVATELVNFLVLPRDIRLIDFRAHTDGANSAATTMNLGLKNVTGGATTFNDADYFIAALDINAAGRTGWTNLAVYQVTLDDEYILQGVIAGATVATAAAVVEVTVWYEFKGNL